MKMEPSVIVKNASVSMRVAATLAQDAGLVAQGLHGCGCTGLKVRVRHGKLSFHLPTCGHWKPIAETVEKSLRDKGYEYPVVELIRRNVEQSGVGW